MDPWRFAVPLSSAFTLDELQAVVDHHAARGHLKALVFPTISQASRYQELVTAEALDETAAYVPVIVNRALPAGQVGLVL